MEPKIIGEVQKKIDSILADREEELTKLDECIRDDSEAVSKAVKEMENATASGNLEIYRQAKNARAEALDAQEMHQARRDALMNKPLISRQEYDKTVAAIVSAVAVIESDTKKILCRLSDEMADASANLEKVSASANDVLRRLQSEIYLDADKTRNAKTGEPLNLAHEQKGVNVYSTISWGRTGVKCAQYADYTGRRW